MFNTILPIDVHNNQLTITHDGTKKTVFIPVGTYGKDDTANIIKSTLNTEFGGTNGIDVIYDSNTFRFIISSSVGDITIHGSESTSQSWMGISNTTSTPASSYTSENLANLSGSDSLLLVSSSLRAESIFYIGREEINVLGRVNINNSVGSIVSEDDVTDWVDAKQRLYSLNLLLLDELTYRQIDLQNGGSFRCRIQME